MQFSGIGRSSRRSADPLAPPVEGAAADRRDLRFRQAAYMAAAKTKPAQKGNAPARVDAMNSTIKSLVFWLVLFGGGLLLFGLRGALVLIGTIFGLIVLACLIPTGDADASLAAFDNRSPAHCKGKR